MFEQLKKEGCVYYQEYLAFNTVKRLYSKNVKSFHSIANQIKCKNTNCQVFMYLCVHRALLNWVLNIIRWRAVFKWVSYIIRIFLWFWFHCDYCLKLTGQSNWIKNRFGFGILCHSFKNPSTAIHWFYILCLNKRFV